MANWFIKKYRRREDDEKNSKKMPVVSSGNGDNRRYDMCGFFCVFSERECKCLCRKGKRVSYTGQFGVSEYFILTVFK